MAKKDIKKLCELAAALGRRVGEGDSKKRFHPATVATHAMELQRIDWRMDRLVAALDTGVKDYQPYPIEEAEREHLRILGWAGTVLSEYKLTCDSEFPPKGFVIKDLYDARGIYDDNDFRF